MAKSSPRLPALALAAACSFRTAGSLAEPSSTLPPPAAAATVLGSEIRTSDPEELRFLVLRALTDRYAAERAVEVTPNEIDAYLARMAAVAEQDRREREARLAGIERQLAAPGLADDRRMRGGIAVFYWIYDIDTPQLALLIMGTCFGFFWNGCFLIRPTELHRPVRPCLVGPAVDRLSLFDPHPPKRGSHT